MTVRVGLTLSALAVVVALGATIVGIFEYPDEWPLVPIVYGYQAGIALAFVWLGVFITFVVRKAVRLAQDPSDVQHED